MLNEQNKIIKTLLKNKNEHTFFGIIRWQREQTVNILKNLAKLCKL